MNPDKPADPWQGPPDLDDLKRHDIWALRRAFLERLWGDVAGLKVIEVGSGPAHDSLTFAERGARVTAVDMSLPGLVAAKRIYGQLGLPIDAVQADGLTLPFKSRSFDIAFNAGVLEHFVDRDIQAMIGEMIRVVKPGGHVLAFCPNRYNIYYQAHLRRVVDHQYSFERAFSAHFLKARFEAAGLLDLGASGVHVHPAPNYLLPSWLPKHHRIEPTMRACFSRLEDCNGLNRFKSLIGQDIVVWGTVAG